MHQVQWFSAELLRGPANRVTLTRAVIGIGVAGLVVARFWTDPVTGPATTTSLVLLAAVALVLDGVDGRVARGTGTASAFGARFDMEVDALLILILSVDGARAVGWWVLAIGAARYVFALARRALPRLQGTAPPRSWCKVVAVVQGVALTVAASQLLSAELTAAVLVAALALLAESFGREVWQLWWLDRAPAAVHGRRGAIVAPVDAARVVSVDA